MRNLKQLMLLAMLGFGALTLQACNDGPMEEAGEAIDEAADDAGDALDEAGDSIEDACEDATDTNC